MQVSGGPPKVPVEARGHCWGDRQACCRRDDLRLDHLQDGCLQTAPRAAGIGSLFPHALLEHEINQVRLASRIFCEARPG